jgi:hypothetical protein
MWHDTYILCSVLGLVHTSDYSFSGLLNYSSIAWEVALGENCETNRNLVFTHLDTVANEDFLTPIIGVVWYYSIWGWGCQPNLTLLLPCDNNESINSTVRGPSVTYCFTGRNVATTDTEPPAFLVLLTVCSCCTSWFLNTPSLYDTVTDGEGSDLSATSLLWSQHTSKKTVHILTCFWVQANRPLSQELLLSYQCPT